MSFKITLLVGMLGLMGITSCDSTSSNSGAVGEISLNPDQAKRFISCFNSKVLPNLKPGEQTEAETQVILDGYNGCMNVPAAQKAQMTSEGSLSALRAFLGQIIRSSRSAQDKYFVVLSDSSLQKDLRAAFSEQHSILALLDFVQTGDRSSEGCIAAGVPGSFCGIIASLEQGQEISQDTIDTVLSDITSDGQSSGGGNHNGDGNPVACVAGSEICNGIDDDCDGTVDDENVCLLTSFEDSTSQPGRYNTDGLSGSVRDIATGLVWEHPVTGISSSSIVAAAYCANLTLDSKPAGTWRLPTRTELLGLVDYTVSSSPKINSTYFGGTNNVYFWSSTAVAFGVPSDRYVIDFGTAQTSYYLTLAQTRCVRLDSGVETTPPNPKFTDNGDSTITDNSTGLIWQKDGIAGLTGNWSTHNTYCANLTLGSSTDWRLPTIRELSSVYDESGTGSVLMDPVFIGPNNSGGGDIFYWSSTLRAGTSTVAWVLNFYNSNIEDNPVSSSGYRVRCVRR